MTPQDESTLALRLSSTNCPVRPVAVMNWCRCSNAITTRTAVFGWFDVKRAGRNTIWIIEAGPLGWTMYGPLRRQNRPPLNTLNGQKRGSHANP